MHYRRLANPNYTTVSIPVTPSQEAQARRFCEQRALEGCGFDSVGMYLSRAPYPIRHLCSGIARIVSRDHESGPSRTFCSKYITEVLKHIGIEGFEGMDPASTSPSMVHRALVGAVRRNGGGEVLAVNPYKRGLLLQVP